MTLKLPTWWPWGVALLCVWLYGREQMRTGALTERQTRLVFERDSLGVVARSLHTVYVRQTDTLRLTRLATDTLLAVDTVIHTDTVRQLIQAERNACDALLGTCAAEKANLRSQIGNLEQQLGNAKRIARPSRFGCVAGGVASSRGVQPGIGCGFRITR